MALSKQTQDHILEAKSHIRAAIKSAAVNEKPPIVKQLSDMLMGLEHLEKYDEIMDMIDNRKPGSKGMFGTFFDEDE